MSFQERQLSSDETEQALCVTRSPSVIATMYDANWCEKIRHAEGDTMHAFYFNFHLSTFYGIYLSTNELKHQTHLDPFMLLIDAP